MNFRSTFNRTLWAALFIAAAGAIHLAAQTPPITEDELRQQLQGKTFYLRDGYLENNLHFTELGGLDGNSPRASYTLSLVEITRVRMEKHRLQLEGVRYGLHFLGALASEDQAQAVDRVRLTTKKKPLRIAIDRETVVHPKKQKDKRNRREAGTPKDNIKREQTEMETPEQELKGSKATTSQEHANRLLRSALDRIFAPGIDERMIATLPDYWRFYYRAAGEKKEYRPADPTVLRQPQVDKKARLLTAFEPPSNEYAQNNGVAGMSMYHVVVDADGKAGEIAVGRPIGFGLDENAVDSIRKARFEPAMKDGKPVPVVLDLTVQFRIFSNRTAASASTPANAAAQGKSPALPGPYTLRALQQEAQGAAQQQTPDASSQPAATEQQPAPQPQQQ